MKKIFSEYGGVIVTVIAIVALIGLVTLLMQPGGVMDNAFSNLVQSFVDKTDEVVGDDSTPSDPTTPSVPSDVTNYTMEEIEADEHLYAVGSTKRIWVVAKFNDDYSEVVFTKNGEDSDGTIGVNTSTDTLDGGSISVGERLTNVSSVVLKPGIANVPGMKGSSLKTIAIPNTVTKIGMESFLECTALESVDIPGSVKKIEASAFQKCTALTTVTLHDGLEKIDPKAFQNCKLLTSITIPDSVTTLGTWAFVNCYALENVTLSNNITSIEEKTFLSCTALKSVVIPEGVTNIGAQAFGYCSKLASITIPSNVTSISDDAFQNCGKLTTVYGTVGSYAETWAAEKGYTFTAA